MKYRDICSSLFWIALGMYFCIGAIGYGFKSQGVPGGGFFPFFVGSVLIGLSLMIMIPALVIKNKSKEPTPEEPFFSEDDSAKKLLITVGALFGYALALPYLGYFLTTFIFLVIVLRYTYLNRWSSILITAFLSSAISYVLFYLWLKVQLPRGLMWAFL